MPASRFISPNEGEPHPARRALVARCAGTARHDLAPGADGALALSLGLSARAGDHGMLERGLVVYDALFARARFAAQERNLARKGGGRGR